MNILKLVSFTFIVSFICTGTLAGNAIYKWTDENGVVHYSQTAPKGQEVQVISTKTPRSEEITEDMEDGDEEESEADVITDEDEKEFEAEAEDGTEKNTKATPETTKDQATCDKALKAIQDLQNPVVTLNGKVMTIDEKNAQLKNMDEIVQIHCP